MSFGLEQQPKFIQKWAREGSNGSQSGYAVAISPDGNRIGIGKPFAANTRGVSSLWICQINDVRQVQQLTGMFRVAETAFNCFKKNGNTIAIGDPKFDGANTDNGHVRIFDLQTIDAVQTWVQRGNDIEGTAAGDLSGTSIDLSSDGNT